MHVIIWKYRIPSGKERDFEAAYNANGLWAKLFRRDIDYIGTELLQDRNAADCYATIDRWHSLEAFQRFMNAHKHDYEELDRECNALTIHEEKLARLKFVDSYLRFLTNFAFTTAVDLCP